MSYVKQNFVDGEILTAEQLNYIEDAIAQIVNAIENGNIGGNGIDWFGAGTNILSGADLDEYKTVGKYYAVNATTATSLVNCPTTQNFVLYVFSRTTSSVVTQMIIDLNGKMYVRSRSTSAWKSWVEYATTKDVSKAIQEAIDSGAFNGADGVSATHEWNGTVLTITSASGTSSADLKGEKGEQGIQGEQGEKGEKGEGGEKGETGATGKSAYEIAVDGGYLGTEAEFAKKLAVEQLDWFGEGVSIPENSDLDTYTTVGKYYISSNAKAKTLINCPTASNFVLYVLTRTNGPKSQMIIDYNGKMYVRSRSTSAWRDWKAYVCADELLDKTYPVGSIYMSVNSTSPADLFGGTWEQIKDTFLLAAGDTYSAGSTGGETEGWLTIDEIPNKVPSYLAVYMWKRTA